MESFGRNLNDEPSGVKMEPRWGWLAAAAAAGLWVARKHPRAGAALGLGLVAWRCLGKHTASEPEQPQEEPACEGSVAAAATENEPGGAGGWLLNLEPVPLVIREENAPPVMGQGQGDGLLNQEPGETVEELDWVPPVVVVEEFWLNEGVEIPDAVELPELEEPSGTASQG